MKRKAEKCECCQEQVAILWVAKQVGEFDKEYFHLCKDCSRKRFSFITKFPSLVYAKREVA